MDAPLTSLEAPWLAPRGAARPSLTLGAMNFGKRTSPADAERILGRAEELGIGLIDTANAYADGESERIVGKFLRSRRERFLVATKVGLGRVGKKAEGLSREAIERAVTASLDRLGTDYIDIYYLHAPDPATPIEETIDAVADLLRKGLVHHFGVSNFASWQILEIMKLCDARGIAHPRVSQVIYNMLVRQIEIEYARFASRYGVHTTVYNPLAGGLLSGRYHAGDAIAQGSRFDKNRMYERRYWSPRVFEAVEAYRALAERARMSLLELAYAWLATSPAVDSILVGPGSVEHLDAAAEACKKVLPAEIRAEAQAIAETLAGTDATYAR
jgi:aryl-alcohol dehydrogenase-like predicted oxidoreductase